MDFEKELEKMFDKVFRGKVTEGENGEKSELEKAIDEAIEKEAEELSTSVVDEIFEKLESFELVHKKNPYGNTWFLTKKQN